MAKRIETLKGIRKRLPNDQLDSARYEYLTLDQAEPNPGSPDSDRSIFVSDADGTRSFTKDITLNQLAFENGVLQEKDTSDYALVIQGDPTTHSNADSVGYKQLSAISTGGTTDGLQLVTEVENITDRGIRISGNDDPATGAGLVISNSVGMSVGGVASFSDSANFTGDIVYDPPPNADLSTRIVVVNANNRLEERSSSTGFAFTSPTLENVTSRSIELGSPDGRGDFAVTDHSIEPRGLALRDQPVDRTSGDERTALVWTSATDSVGARELTDLAVQNVTTAAIETGNLTAEKLYVRDPTVGALPPSGTIPLVFYASDSEYAIVDINVENLDANFETLQSVTGRQAIGLDFGETTNEMIISGELRLRDTTLTTPTTSTYALMAETTGTDSAVVRRRLLEDIAFNDALVTLQFVTDNDDSTTREITVGGLISKGNISSTTLLQAPDLTLTGLGTQTGEFTALTINGSGVVGTNEVVDVATAQDITGDKSFTGITQLDSVTIDGGVGGDGFKVTNLQTFTNVNTALMVNNDSEVGERTLAASAFVAPDLQAVTDIGATTTNSIQVTGIDVTAAATFDSATFADSVTVSGDLMLPSLESSTSLDVLVRDGNKVRIQTFDQAAVDGESLHTVTSQGLSTSNSIGVNGLYIYDGDGFSDNNTLDEFNVVIDSNYNMYVRNAGVIFMGESDGTATNNRSFIRYTNPAFAGYPGIYDFVSDDTNEAATTGNALLRAGGLILTDSATIGTNLTITGNLTVNGTTTSLNSTSLAIADKNIVIARNSPSLSATANSGILISDSDDPYASFLWDGANAWVVSNDLQVDSDLTVDGVTTLNGTVFTTSLPAGSTETTAVFRNASDQLVTRALDPSAFDASLNTWSQVLEYGDSTGGQNPYIKDGLRIDRDGFTNSGGNYSTSRTVMVFDELDGTRDSVGFRQLGELANRDDAEATLQFVTDQGAITTNAITVDNINISTPTNFDVLGNPYNNLQRALFINNDSVGYRDLGDLAFLDSDGETLASITSKANQNNTVTAQNVVLPKLAFSDLVARTDVTQGLFVDNSGGQDSVVKRTLSSSAFSVPTLTEVLTAGDSTNLHAVFADGIELPERGTPIVTSPNVSDDLAAGFYRMLIINDDTDSVARGNIGTIVNTVSQETLQTVTTRGADAEVAAGRRRVDSTDENLEFAGTLFYTGVSDLGSSYDNILVVNDSDREIRIKSLSTVLSSQNLHTVATNGNNTDLSIGANGFYIYDGTGFTDGSQSIDANHVVVIDSDRDAFFRNLDASGLTTLDSTTIDGTLTVNDSARFGVGFDVVIRDAAGTNGQVLIGTDDPTLGGSFQSLVVNGNTSLAPTSTGDVLRVGSTSNYTYLQTNTSSNTLALEAKTGGAAIGVGGNFHLVNADEFGIKIDGPTGDVTIDKSLQVDSDLDVDGIARFGSSAPITLSSGVISRTGGSITLKGGSVDDNRPRLELGNNTNTVFGSNWSLGPDVQIYSGEGEIQLIAGARPGQAGAVTVVNMDSASFNVNVPTTLDSTTINGDLTVNLVAPTGADADAISVVADHPRFVRTSISNTNTGSAAGTGIELETLSGTKIFLDHRRNGNVFAMRSESLTQFTGDFLTFDISGTETVEVPVNFNVNGLTTLDSTTIDGRLGINTGAPDKALVVSGNGADAEIVVNDQAGTPALRLRNAGSTQNAISSTGTSQGQLAFTNSNGNEFMTADSDKLQLKGDTQLHDAAGTNLVIYDSAGAVLWGNV